MANCTVHGCDRSVDLERFPGSHSLRLIESGDADITFRDDILPQKLRESCIATQ
jgi:hypothetical protein